MLLKLITPWFLSFALLALLVAFLHNPWHPFFIISGGVIVFSLIVSGYLVYKYPVQTEFELKEKIDKLSNAPESEEVIQKKAELDKQRVIWNEEIQQLKKENDEREEKINILNSEITVLSSSIIPFLPKKNNK